MFQMEASASCGEPDSLISNIYIETSVNDGVSWTPITFDRRYYKGYTGLYSWEFRNGFQRVTFPLSQSAMTENTRFRVTTDKSPLYLRNIYIGPSCPSMCNNHGRCMQTGECLCDEGYVKVDGTCIAEVRPKEFVETFTLEMNSSQWSDFLGQEQFSVSEDCDKTLRELPAMAFNGGAGRLLATRELDLRDASYIRFAFHACGFSSSSPPQLSASIDGGISFDVVRTLSRFTSDESIFVYISEEYRTAATIFMWIHPQFSSAGSNLWVR